MSQQYSLRWNNHQPNFISTFTTLLTTRTLVDVTLAAEGKQLQAHKIVLSACSTYFQSLFVDNPSRHPIVILKDVTFADLRTMVDFMYYGEVNVTEEQLPQVLETAKLLKIKGLTEMPDSTSLTRSQGTLADFQPGDSNSQRHSSSPAASPSTKRKKRRRSSSGSTPLELLPDEVRPEDSGQMDLVRGETITLSSVPQQRPRRDFDHRPLDTQQAADPHNLNVEPMQLDHSTPAGMAQAFPDGELPPEAFSPQSGLKLRRSKYFKRQSRVQPEEREIRKQVSEPLPATASSAPTLQKHQSYPQYSTSVADDNRRSRTQEQEVGSLLIRTVTVIDRQASTSAGEGPPAARVSHTPAVRSGPPLSCNFCWNTVDECGRILRRKTQYHCPECRTNLCIVPCFHEYHDGPEADATASAR